ncbi:paraquat-inducible protein A [Entomomonas sp. E2T0]|uniref:paraquat-inducible protein A n=1 Tax=Entomomonas sp. E2T0 TaxID=2930213 RepID=UPI0022283B99|nr:paraquat-inducible protein A [Entomomonas sp. E2T0]UYZ85064.1 paraquat-inducible protein A [Entomomonas sp. E2T0]
MPNTHSEQNTDLSLSNLIACPECDLLMACDHLQDDERITCSRCGAKLKIYRRNMATRALSLVLTALILFIPASFVPILKINILGQSQQASVWDSVLGLYHSGMVAISVLVLMCGFAIPLCKLLCQLYVLLAIYTNRGKVLAITFFKTYQQLKEWGMLEIYLLGILVSIVKLHGMAELHIGIGLACFIMLLFVQVWLEIVMNQPQTWVLLEGMNDSNKSD